MSVTPSIIVMTASSLSLDMALLPHSPKVSCSDTYFPHGVLNVVSSVLSLVSQTTQ